MSNSRRGLRGNPTQAGSPTPALNIASSSVTFTNILNSSCESIQIVTPGSKLPGLSPAELKLLREKQKRLATNTTSTLNTLSKDVHRNALESTLVFAQYEAGTAVCIDQSGWVLTCAHCFGDTEEEYQGSDKKRWLLFYTGLAVQVECRLWDLKRDLALLRVIAIESRGGREGQSPRFASVPIFIGSLRYRMPILCIGQPGRDDLEATSGARTKYNLVEISEGTFRGMMPGADPQDNSEIGTLKHDAWTYWGHSGAPLLSMIDGTLIGLHSSWDDQTAMRHGIPRAAIIEFLKQQTLIVPTGTSTDTDTNDSPAHGTISSPIIIE